MHFIPVDHTEMNEMDQATASADAASAVLEDISSLEIWVLNLTYILILFIMNGRW